MKLFISHASEDKNEIAKPLADELIRQGYSVWYDEYQLAVGQSLTEQIDKGLANCDFGIIILSNHFFRKNWPKRELSGLVTREIQEGRNVLLPVWHGVDIKDVIRYSPPLADRVAAKTSDGLATVVKKLCQSIGKPARAPSIGKLVRNPSDDYLKMDKDDRLRKIRGLRDIGCGMPDDLWLLAEAAAFLEIAQNAESDPQIKKEIESVQIHVEEQARLVVEEMKQQNPAQ